MGNKQAVALLSPTLPRPRQSINLPSVSTLKQEESLTSTSVGDVDKAVKENILRLLRAISDSPHHKINVCVSGAPLIGTKRFCKWVEHEYPREITFADVNRGVDPQTVHIKQEARQHLEECCYVYHQMDLSLRVQKYLYGWQGLSQATPSTSISPASSGSGFRDIGKWPDNHPIRLFHRTALDIKEALARTSVDYGMLSPSKKTLLDQQWDVLESIEACKLRRERTLWVYFDYRLDHRAYAQRVKTHYTETTPTIVMNSRLLGYFYRVKTYLDERHLSGSAISQDPMKIVIQVDDEFSRDERYFYLAFYHILHSISRLQQEGIWGANSPSEPSATAINILAHQTLNTCGFYTTPGKTPPIQIKRSSSSKSRTVPRPVEEEYEDIDLEDNLSKPKKKHTLVCDIPYRKLRR